jgi:hypothetical protein
MGFPMLGTLMFPMTFSKIGGGGGVSPCVLGTCLPIPTSPCP